MCELIELYGGQFNSGCEILMHKSFDSGVCFYEFILQIPARVGKDIWIRLFIAVMFIRANI